MIATAAPPDVATYKTVLKRVLDNRPSGMRQRLAEAIGKNRSFVSQISNPAYQVPIPARHVGLIFEICHFAPQERAAFLKVYAPGVILLVASYVLLTAFRDFRDNFAAEIWTELGKVVRKDALLATNTSSTQVSQWAPGATSICAPSVAKASFNRAKRKSGGKSGPLEAARGMLAFIEVTETPGCVVGAERAGENTPSINV